MRLRTNRCVLAARLAVIATGIVVFAFVLNALGATWPVAAVVGALNGWFGMTANQDRWPLFRIEE